MVVSTQTVFEVSLLNKVWSEQRRKMALYCKLLHLAVFRKSFRQPLVTKTFKEEVWVLKYVFNVFVVKLYVYITVVSRKYAPLVETPTVMFKVSVVEWQRKNEASIHRIA